MEDSKKPRALRWESLKALDLSTGTDAWDVGITAYSATNVLRITITGEANKRINWSIAVDYVQIPSDVTL